MHQEIQDAFNDHLNAEFYSSYLYLSMMNYFAAENWDGMASWMQLQADEERMHAMKFVDHINERGGRVILQQIDTPKIEFGSVLEAFEDSYQHECLVTRKINQLVDLAAKHSDHAAIAFLQWFVSEQVEEESTVLSIVEKLRKVGDNPMGLLMIDDQVGQRTGSDSEGDAG
ncbi:ferritin [Crateriforma conspicua]|uniref:Ferritin n=1 Tax=Crateriforma conspicua TaxID=2527996 RepID=A0A5C5YG41_9PLAN|nr:ferritin [Crateriforma conspicua]QDV61589.1 Ferritin [Crateriforma conspicua]TWT72162.1 Ferritin [Crateriforma conspicua]